LFREFAITITAAILISGIVSLTLTPMLCSRFLKAASHRKPGRLFRATELVFDWMLDIYDHSLQWVLRHRASTLAFSILILIATVYLFVRIPKGFIPDADNDQLMIQTEAEQGISFQEISRYQQTMADIVRRDPAVIDFFSRVGGSNGGFNGGPNFGLFFLHLKPHAERDRLDVIINRLRQKMSGQPFMRVYLQNPPTIRIGGQVTTAAIQYTLQGSDTAELYAAARKLQEDAAAIPGLTDVISDLQLQNPQLNVSIDRDKAATVKVSAQQIEDALYDAYGPRWVSTIYTPTNQYRVMLDLLPEYQARPDALAIFMKSDDGRLVPLGTLAKVTQDVGPLTIHHLGQLPSVTVSFNLKPGVSLGDAVDQFNDLTRNLPATISGAFQGTAREFENSVRNLMLLLGIAILVIYIVLGILYESYIHPLTILSGLPSAIFGALLTLWLFHMDLNIYGFVGLIMLIGIVKKNAIMQIDFALSAQRTENIAPLEAIYQGCLVRFRPIMMTTMSALLGSLPIALGYGAGGEARQTLGLAVVGGLLFSQLITLYLTPVVYTYMAALSERRPHPKRPSDVQEAPVATLR